MTASVDYPDHPFVPGAKVAITNGWDNWHEGTVERTYKTGRFTLKGSTQQWRPSKSFGKDSHWVAHQTGNDSWSRTSLRIWDAAADSEIKEIFVKQARKKRARDLVGKFEHFRDDALTDAMLDQIEAALTTPAHKPSP